MYLAISYTPFLHISRFYIYHRPNPKYEFSSKPIGVEIRAVTFNPNRLSEPNLIRNGQVQFQTFSRFIRWVLVLIIHGYRASFDFYPKPIGYPIKLKYVLKKHRFVTLKDRSVMCNNTCCIYLHIINIYIRFRFIFP